MEVAARIRESDAVAKVVVLSAYSDKRFVTEMLRAGASGYVTKSAAGTELVRAIRGSSMAKGISHRISPARWHPRRVTKHALERLRGWRGGSARCCD